MMRQGLACLVAVIVVGGCGPVGSTGTHQPSPAWQIYKDKLYGFSISYPPGFTFQAQGSGPPGGLKVYRAVDNRYLDGYPPGQVELGVFTMDSDSLANWITRHAGTTSSSDQAIYWQSTSNVVKTSAAGRPAITFDWSSPGEGPMTVHATTFLKDASKVIVFDWWSTNPAYASSVENVARAMLATFEG